MDYIEIPLSRGLVARIDKADEERVCAFKWFALQPNGPGGNFYAATRIGHWTGPTTYLHNFLMGKKPGFCIDHKNLDSLDCRKENMRFGTKLQNNVNKNKRRQHNGKPCTSKYKGVHYMKTCGKWRAKVARIHIGVCENEIDAAKAYDKKAIEMYGEFANPNF